MKKGPNFAAFTRSSNGKTIYLNPEWVEAFEQMTFSDHSTLTVITCAGHHAEVMVRETPDVVRRRLEGWEDSE